MTDYSCPACLSSDNLIITASVSVRLTPDGSEAFGEHEWDKEAPANCGNCDWYGQVRELIDVNP